MTPKNPPPVGANKTERQADSTATALPLLSTSEVAAFLGVPVATIYAWRQKGYGPPGIKVGKHIKFRKADLEEWLCRQEGRAS